MLNSKFDAMSLQEFIEQIRQVQNMHHSLLHVEANDNLILDFNSMWLYSKGEWANLGKEECGDFSVLLVSEMLTADESEIVVDCMWYMSYRSGQVKVLPLCLSYIFIWLLSANTDNTLQPPPCKIQALLKRGWPPLFTYKRIYIRRLHRRLSKRFRSC